MQKSQTDLQNRLESYSLASKGLQAAKNWKGGGAMLATVAGSALALATNANAGIIYSGVQNLTVSRPDRAAVHTSTAAFTIGGSPWHIRAFNFVPTRFSTASALLGQLVFGSESFMNSNFFFAKKLASGANISSGQAFGFGNGFPKLQVKNGASVNGYFLNNQTDFVGIKFKQGVNTHFGWIRVVDNIPGPGNAVTVTAIDWAYNDVAGQSIQAGEGIPTSAPEPSTASMAILAAGAAGVLAWRKRRKQLAA